MMRYFLLRMIFGMLGICSLTSVWGQTCSVSPTGLSKNFSSPATVTYTTNTPIGGVLMSGSFTGNAGTFTVTCNTAFSSLNYVPRFGPVTGIANVYPTGVAGVGIRITNITGNTAPWPVSVPVTPAVTQSSYNANISVNFQLIRTGAITSGSTLTGAMGYLQIGSNNAVGFAVAFAQTVTFTQITQACAVNTTNLNVSLGTFAKSNLTTVGASTPEVPFNIQVVCSTVPNGTPTKIAVTFTDAANSTNTSNLLPLSGGTASGVAVRVKYNNTAISYGLDSSSATNPNRVAFPGTYANGTYNFPFTASFVSTGTVVEGTASAVATFTMSYQ